MTTVGDPNDIATNITNDPYPENALSRPPEKDYSIDNDTNEIRNAVLEYVKPGVSSNPSSDIVKKNGWPISTYEWVMVIGLL